MCEPAPVPSGPVVPEDFSLPKPRMGLVSLSSIFEIGPGALANILRVGTGKFVMGYTTQSRNGQVVEMSTLLPENRPGQPLVVYELEACPDCRKVREAICLLDLDVEVKPCPLGGTAFRKYVAGHLGMSQFPYLVDPNTDFSGYEVGRIIDYLFTTYGGSVSRVPFILGPLGGMSAGVQGLTSRGRGLWREKSVVPAPKPLELWGYEASPFCRIVRERLCELEIPYLMHSTSHGSKKRSALTDIAGRVQVPFLVDPNTGVAMFESASIVDYLTRVYGPKAPGAVMDPEQVYLKTVEDSTAGVKSSSLPSTGTSRETESGTPFADLVGSKKVAASSSAFPANAPSCADPPNTTGPDSEKATTRSGYASAPNVSSDEIPPARRASPPEQSSAALASASTGNADREGGSVLETTASPSGAGSPPSGSDISVSGGRAGGTSFSPSDLRAGHQSKEAGRTELVDVAAPSKRSVSVASASRGLEGEDLNTVLQSSDSVLERFCEKYPEAGECRTYDS